MQACPPIMFSVVSLRFQMTDNFTISDIDGILMAVIMGGTILWDSSICIVRGYGLGGRSSIPGRAKTFLFSAHSRPAMRPTQTPIQWARGDLSPEVKRPGHKADHSPPSSVEVKNGGDIPPLRHTSVFMEWYLIKHRDDFTFAFTIVWDVTEVYRQQSACSWIAWRTGGPAVSALCFVLGKLFNNHNPRNLYKTTAYRTSRASRKTESLNTITRILTQPSLPFKKLWSISNKNY
jgi:hypothetical protein